MSNGYVKYFFKSIEWIQKLWKLLWGWKFRQIYGRDAGDKYHIIYSISNVPNRNIIFTKPEPKVKRNNYSNATSLSTINSCSTTRVIGYLVYTFGEKVIKPPIISSDVDSDRKMDISFISIGGVTNLKTCDVLRDGSNHFLNIGNGLITHQFSKLPIIKFSSDVAYGIIIKINPQSNPERTWICCAGFEEWGTSGAAWFLANKWKNIRKWAKDKPFAIITKTEYEIDESTNFVGRFLTSEEVEDFVRETTITVTETTTKTNTRRSSSTARSSSSAAPSDSRE